MNDHSDEKLMAAYAAGDERAFEVLFDRMASRVHGFFLRAFRSPGIADDLMQETFLRLHRARRDYQEDLPLSPWLFTIAARVRIDEWIRRGKSREDADADVVEGAADSESFAADQATDGTDMTEALRGALDRLPESQRTVLHLHRYEGMTLAQIASVLGTTEGAVKLRAFRAYDTLRRLLGPLLRSSQPEVSTSAEGGLP